MLNIGQIEYANCTPLFQVLQERFGTSNYTFITGVPSELNKLLLNGKIDVCPSSSIEYAYYPDNYKILPNLSISSYGAVASVLLFSKIPIENLDGKKILLSSESATSVNLLKIIMCQRYCCTCSYEVAHPSASVTDDYAAILLIGDSALRASFVSSEPFVFDLGEIWSSWTGLPFVFALWLCRKDIAEDAELIELAQHLIRAKELVPECLERIALSSKEVAWIGYESLLSYWRNNISYQFDENAQNGLMLYYEKCYASKLIAAVPKLHFAVPAF